MLGNTDIKENWRHSYIRQKKICSIKKSDVYFWFNMIIIFLYGITIEIFILFKVFKVTLK